MLPDVELRQEEQRLAEHQLWQTVDAGCTGEKAQGLALLKVLKGQERRIGNMGTIQPNH
jgi:hypothetical protein